MNLPKNGKFTAKYALFRHFTMECTVAGICTTLIPQLYLQVRIATPIASAYCDALQRNYTCKYNRPPSSLYTVIPPLYIVHRVLLILAISIHCVGVVSQRVRLPALVLRLVGSTAAFITRAASCSISSCRVRR